MAQLREWINGSLVEREETAEEEQERLNRPLPRWQVGYVTMLDRMTDANANAVATYVEGLNAKLRERIRREGVWSDNQTIRDRLTQAGEDPDVILAR